MNNFQFLTKYIIPSESEAKLSHYNKYIHHFFPIDPAELANAESSLGKLPLELVNFYKSIGYGQFHINNGSQNNSIFSIHDLIEINLKMGEHAMDPDLEIYDCFSIDTRLLFFNVIEGIYLFIDNIEKNDSNAIYYFDLKIFDSLNDFLIAMDINPNLLIEISKNY